MRAPLKRLHRVACAALVAASFQGIQAAHAAPGNWANFGTVSMTDATHPKLTSDYGCYTDGRDIVCDSAASAVNFGTGGLISYGGATVVGTVSASAVSATYVSSTVLQINASSMPCSTGLGGAIRYSSTSNTLEVCTGSAWSTLSSNTTPGNLSGSGSATAIAYWNGANSLTYESSATSGLYWDHTNGRLGIGTNAPSNNLSISPSTGNATVALNIPAATGYGQYQIIGDGVRSGWFGYMGSNAGFGDRNGFVEVGANQTGLAFLTGSAVEAMRILSTSQVGIGTQSPTATLQVSGTFTVSNSAQAAAAPSLYIPSNGAIGIGMNTPLSALDVSGSMRVRSIIPAGYGSMLGMFASSDSTLTNYDRISFGVISPTNMFLESADQANNKTNFYLQPFGGNVGIGGFTIAPASSLTVVGGEIQTGSSGAACTTSKNGGAIRYSAGTLYYCNGSNTWTSITGGGAGFTGGGSATAIAFWNGPNSLTYESATTSGLYWNHVNGRLGLGTNAPNYPLDISASSSGVAWINISNVLSGAGSAAGISLAANNNLGATLLELSGGFTPAGEYQPSSTLLRASTANTGGLILGAAAANPIRFYTNTFERMRIDGSTGNVGIGTVTPTATLQVSGTFTVSQTGQDTLSAASLNVDSRGVSVSSIVHITGSAISPIGAGGNAILSGTSAVSTSSAGIITLSTNGADRLLIDNSGNIAANGLVMVSTTGAPALKIYNGSSQRISAKVSSGTGLVYVFDDGTSGAAPLNLGGPGTVGVGVYIDGSGNVGMGSTLGGTPNPGVQFFPSLGVMKIGNNAGASGSAFAQFLRSGVGVGSITQNGTTSVLFNTTSDRRVKEDITDTREGLQKLMQIGVHDFAFRADPSHTIVNGFIAQELEKVYPEAVTTNGDDGKVPLKDKSKVWAVDYGRVTPLIVKAVQDLKHLFDTDHAQLQEADRNIQTLGRQVEALQAEVQKLRQAQHP